MIQIELSENDVFKIMAGSFEDRLDFFIEDEIIGKLNLNTVKSIIQNNMDCAQTAGKYREDRISETIQFLQSVAYNRHKSQHSEEIATFVIDKLIEILCHDFY